MAKIEVTCVQCQKQLVCYKAPVIENVTEMDAGSVSLSVCINPKCPNYGLLAVSIEELSKGVKE